MFFNKSKPLFLAIICLFAAQTAFLNAAQDPSAGTGLWATFVASMNNLPSFSSLMSSIAEKISSFMASSSSSLKEVSSDNLGQYKGYAVGFGGMLAGWLGYKAIVHKRAQALKRELFYKGATYPESEMFNYTKHSRAGAWSPAGAELEGKKVAGPVEDIRRILNKMEKVPQVSLDNKALVLLLDEREEALKKAVPILTSGPLKAKFDYEKMSFKDLTNYICASARTGHTYIGKYCENEEYKSNSIRNQTDFWIAVSYYLNSAEGNPDQRLQKLELLQKNSPNFSNKSGLSETIKLWKNKKEKEQENKILKG